ncbi:MAG: hypothetical protein KatS3mg103_0996 [Phycisphaerales bacterium]|nr:MAG: hypothetical protein KatS3mg103_0996 [Phycisphaerales bacterium]
MTRHAQRPVAGGPLGRCGAFGWRTRAGRRASSAPQLDFAAQHGAGVGPLCWWCVAAGLGLVLAGSALAQGVGGPVQVQGAPPLGEGAKALTTADWLAIIVRVAAPLVLVILFLADFIRPGSFKRAGRRDVSAYPWPVWLFGAFVVVSAQIFGAQAFGQIESLWNWLAQRGGPVQPLPESPTRQAALTQLGSVLFGAFAGGVMVYLLNKREHDEGHCASGWATCRWGCWRW